MTDFLFNLYLQESAGIDRRGEPIRIGVPLPRGLLQNASDLKVVEDGSRVLPLQSRTLDRWPDGSLKWVLLDFSASVTANSKATLTVFKDSSHSDTPPDRTGLSICQVRDMFTIDTGSAAFSVSQKGLGPFDSVVIAGRELIDSSGSGIHLLDRNGRNIPAKVESIAIEEEGPLRSTIKMDGNFLISSRERINFLSRLTFFAGLSTVLLEFQLHNPRAALHPGGLWDLGDPHSFHFSDLSLAMNTAAPVTELTWLAERNSLPQTGLFSNWSLYQDSSGGENWNCENHLDSKGRIAVSFPGYRVLRKDHVQENILAEGKRAAPWVKLATRSGWFSAAVNQFWQNFPKALRVENGKLSVGIFPAENVFGFELQPGEKKRHTLYLDFGRPEDETIISRFQYPLDVFADPEWIETSGAISSFTVHQSDSNGYLSYIGNVVEGPHSFFSKREIIDEFGWRNFGDLYADHEAVNHKGPGKFISHYNNQYDFIYGAAVHFLRTGDGRWAELMRDCARHTIDIDIYHTDDDKPAYNHGLFWHTDHYRNAATCSHRSYSRNTLKELGNVDYGGGPANEHNYSSGLLHYYFLTGDPEGRAAVLELGEWVLAMDDGALSPLGLIDDGPTGLASQTAGSDYHGPGRGPGNCLNTLIDAYRLTNSRLFFSKAEELIQRCIHPKDDIALRGLDDPEHRWSYLAFLQILGKYLDFKLELGETDYCFHYARESLLHYADWMVENEVPYKDVLHKVEIPTETWPAQDIRKCHVLHFAAKYCQPASRAKYSERAEFFIERCIEDLLSFETAMLTRPLVILSVFGYTHAFFQNQGRIIDFPSYSYDFGSPISFLPQKMRLGHSLKKKAGVVSNLCSRIFAKQYHGILSRIAAYRKTT